jgi:hypothetical protein
MRSIGIRAAPKQVAYSILKIDEDEIRVVEIAHVSVPQALIIPDQLRYLRTAFLDIIAEYDVKRAGLRLAEGVSSNKDPFRIGIEAVLQELLSSSSVERYFCGRINSIAALIEGISTQDMKPLISGEKRFREMDTWGEMKPEQRESFLTAYAALALGR